MSKKEDKENKSTFSKKFKECLLSDEFIKECVLLSGYISDYKVVRIDVWLSVCLTLLGYIIRNSNEREEVIALINEVLKEEIQND